MAKIFSGHYTLHVLSPCIKLTPMWMEPQIVVVVVHVTIVRIEISHFSRIFFLGLSSSSLAWAMLLGNWGCCCWFSHKYFAVYRFEEWKTKYWKTEVDLVSFFDLWIENQILKNGSELFFCLPYWRLKNEILKIESFFNFCFVKLKMKIELTVGTVIPNTFCAVDKKWYCALLVGQNMPLELGNMLFKNCIPNTFWV